MMKKHSNFSTRIHRAVITLSLITISLFAVNSAIAWELVVPPDTSGIVLQTNGPEGNISWGDWWTNDDPLAGNQRHAYKIFVPALTNPAFTIFVDIWDPECLKTGSELDEFRGTRWDTTRFTLVAPDGVTEIRNRTYLPRTAYSLQWNAFASFTAGVYGYGYYTLYASTSTDDQNSYRLRIRQNDPDGIAHNGDEIFMLVDRASFQHTEEGCVNFWFHIPEMPELRLLNFDMDGVGSVSYFDPSQNEVAGVLSGGMVWNNGSLAYPPPGGDVFVDPAVGWWHAEICNRPDNQYIFYPGTYFSVSDQPDTPQLEIEKIADTTQVSINDTLRYSYIVRNTGTGPALNTILTDSLPGTVQYISGDPLAQYQLLPPMELVTWNLGTVLPDASDTLFIDVRVRITAISSIDNWVYSTNSDVFGNIHTASDLITIPVIPSSNGIIGDFVWFDSNSNDVPDPGEAGIGNVRLHLITTLGDTVNSAWTNPAGLYQFVNVIPGSYRIRVDQSTLPQQPNQILIPTGDPNPLVTVFDGSIITNIDFGFIYETVPVELSSFTVEPAAGIIHITWITESETENLGFNLLRSGSKDGSYAKINDKLIQGAGNSARRNVYSYQDSKITAGSTYFYKLEDIDFSGNAQTHGPVQVTALNEPQSYNLQQNYPNPFNARTRITFISPEPGNAKLFVYNLLGQKIRTLAAGYYAKGEHHVIWDGTDDAGLTVPSGIYLYQFTMNQYTSTRKMTLSK